MSANMVLPLHEVMGETVGLAARDALFREAGMRFLPCPEEPVREKQVCALHQSVRRDFGALGMQMLQEAGERAADIVAEYRIPTEGKAMLRRLPWPLATWMMMRRVRQFAWTFGGSARFHAETTATFDLIGNPSIRGERSGAPICVFHRALFQGLFRTLVHPRMECHEISCEACGDGACRFELAVPEEPVS